MGKRCHHMEAYLMSRMPDFHLYINTALTGIKGLWCELKQGLNTFKMRDVKYHIYLNPRQGFSPDTTWQRETSFWIWVLAWGKLPLALALATGSEPKLELSCHLPWP